ncbi:MAG: Imm63 family immunity protein [Acidaminobacteraceae bacterium]
MKIKKLKVLISKYCDVLNIPASKRPTFDVLDTLDKRVELDYIEGEYWYIANDKVNRFNNSSTTDSEELLYWIFSDITFNIAEEECKSNKYDEQSKYNLDLASKQLDLMLKLDKNMYKLLKEHHLRLIEMLDD